MFIENEGKREIGKTPSFPRPPPFKRAAPIPSGPAPDRTAMFLYGTTPVVLHTHNFTELFNKSKYNSYQWQKLKKYLRELFQ
jgi:hypothetical protein